MRWFDKDLGCCEADRTQVTAVHEAIVGRVISRDPWKATIVKMRTQRVRHWRERDDAHSWHWKHQIGNLRHDH